jgi:hypothetical protein
VATVRSGIRSDAYLGATAAIVLLCSVEASLDRGLAPSAPGIDFWQARAGTKAMLTGLTQDPYTRPGREEAYRRYVLPRMWAMRGADGRIDPERRAQLGLLTREDVAMLTVVEINDGIFGYRALEFASSPFLYAVMRSFSGDDYDRDHHLYVVLSLLVLAAALTAFALMAGYPFSAALILASTLGLFLNSQLAELTVANVNPLQLGILAVFAWWHGRGRAGSFLGGVALGLGVAFKPNTLLVPVFLCVGLVAASCWRRALASSAGVAAGCLLAVVASRAVLGDAAPWLSWMSSLPSFLAIDRPFDQGNFSLSQMLRAALDVDPSLPILAAATAAWALARWRGSRADGAFPGSDAGSARVEAIGAVAFGVAAMLLSSRLVWVHYFTLAAPLAIWSIRPALARRKPPLSLLLGAIGVITMTRAVRVLHVMDPGGRAMAGAMVGGVLLLFCVGLYQTSLGDHAALGPTAAGPRPSSSVDSG